MSYLKRTIVLAKISQSVLDTVQREAEKIAQQTGLTAQGVSVKKVEYVKEAGLWYLRVTLAKASGISVNDCETLHRPLSKRLDEIDPIPSAYYLEVCSGASDSSDTTDTASESPDSSTAEESAR